MKARRKLLCVVFCGITPLSNSAGAQNPHRATLSLNGQWDVEDSVGPNEIPRTYHHTVPVPGLTNSAIPAFADVDQYRTRQLLSNSVGQGYNRSDYEKLGDARGISNQRRNYFWYRKTFQAPAQDSVAMIKVNKAQFGTLAFLTGVTIGEHDPCFTAAWFDVTRAIRWNAINELIIRIGAHPGVLPRNVSQGTDFEKNRWTPGIYDDVTLMVMGNPVIETVQVAPQLASPSNPVSGILVQTELHNYSDRAVTAEVEQQVFAWRSSVPTSKKVETQVEIPAGG